MVKFKPLQLNEECSGCLCLLLPLLSLPPPPRSLAPQVLAVSQGTKPR